jgi:hypothetical protein
VRYQPNQGAFADANLGEPLLFAWCFLSEAWAF